MSGQVIPKLSFEEFRQLPSDGKRYELVCGEVQVIPTPATRHQAILQNLSGNLWHHVIKNRLGEVWTAPLDVRLSGETALQPDLVYISNARAGIIQENWIAGAPDLVVEVLSPSNATYDRATKPPIYAGAGVPEVWLVDSPT
jgi:Uma2 family endonuclease